VKQGFSAFIHWVSFTGRLGRSDYNSVNIVALALIITANIVFVAPIHLGMIEGQITVHSLLGWNAWLAGALLLFAVIITVSSSVRRLHDFGWSGWWLVLGLAPLKAFAIFACAIGIVILAFFKGKSAPNEYGAPPPITN